MSESIPCQHCGKYYGHRPTCLSHIIKTDAGRQMDAFELIKQLEQKLSEYEADWLKMRDIAEETKRKLDEAIEVIRWTTLVHDDAKGARDFLAKIEGKL